MRMLIPILLLCVALRAVAGEDVLAVKVVLFPLRQAVISSIIDGNVTRHAFKEGESFKANEVIFTLDDRIFRQRLLRSRAACSEAAAGVNFAKRNLDRTRDLFSKGMQGHQDVEKAELELEVANAKNAAQAASYELAVIDLASCRVTAPFAGRVVKRIVQEHEYVRVGQPLIQIIDDRSLLAVMHLGSDELPKIKMGQEFTVHIDETDTDHRGKINEIAGEIDPGSRTVEVKLLIPNERFLLRSGMSGSLMRPPRSELAANKKKQ